MRILLILMSLLFISCAHEIDRKMASEEEPIVLGMVDLKHTTIRYFPPENKQHLHQHMFYVQTNDWNNIPVDIDPTELVISIKGKKIDHEFERVARGQYTVAFKSDGLKHAFLKLQGKRLKLLIDDEKQLPVKELTKVEIVSKRKYEIILRVTLNDKNARLVSLLDLPDVMVGENVTVRDLRMVKTGIWEIELTYPDMNLLFYLSIRANGVLLDKIFRYQHIER